MGKDNSANFQIDAQKISPMLECSLSSSSSTGPKDVDSRFICSFVEGLLQGIAVIFCDRELCIRQCLHCGGKEALPVQIQQGQPFFSLIEEKATREQLLHQFLRSGELPTQRLALKGKEGQLVWITLRLTTVENGYIAVLAFEDRLLHRIGEWGIAYALQSTGAIHSGLAHHLKNLLLPLNLYLSDPQSLDEEDWQIVHLTLAKMNHLIQTFLRFSDSWPENGSCCTNVTVLIEEILFILSAKFESKNLSLQKRIDPEIHALISPQAFEIIAFNVLVNAIEASPPNRPIAVELIAESERTFRFVVQDRGPGIPLEIQDRIFTPFFTTKAQGTGLGLPTVHRLVHHFGGELELSSNDKGTRIVIRLPRIVKK